MRIVFSDQAKTGLREIGVFIARDSKTRALTFVRELRAKALKIAEMPKAFPLVPRYEHLGLRRRVVGSYLIFYRIDADTLQIVHILHGAQDYEPLLFPRS